jgi:branched-chain amino acid transport system permease protein
MRELWLAYYPLLDIVLVNCGLAASQYLVLRAGLFSLATAGFASLGAYSGAIAVLTFGVPPALGAVIATAAGIAAGALLSIPIARLRGVFQAIATTGFVLIVVSLVLYAEPITGGAVGMNGIPQTAHTAELLLFVAAVLYLLRSISRSGIGRAFDAIRQDETVAVSLGISVTRYHSLAFALSGAIAGLSGCLLAYNTHSLSPDEFGFPMLAACLAGVVLGGRGSIWGPVVGATVLTILPELLRPLTDSRLLLHGALLILVTVYLPHVIVDTLVFYWRRARSAASPGEAAR